MPGHGRAVHLLQDRGGGTDVVFTDGEFCDGRAGCDHLARPQEDLPPVRAAAQNVADPL
jgi:hypothetical protein